MAFMIHSIDGSAKIPGIEYLPCDDISVEVGMVLKASSGHLIVAGTNSDLPQYLCMCTKTVTTDGDLIPVIRINHDMILEAPLQANDSNVALGAKIYLYTDGKQLGAVNSSGKGEIVGFDGKSAGDKVRVRY